jgi:hypothetical protein
MNEPEPSPEDSAERWFFAYLDAIEHRSVIQPSIDGVKYRCPCCGYRTLDERGGYDICPVCFWEDDGQDEQDADTVRGGPNGGLSLTRARQIFISIGACDLKSLEHVRKPEPDEK